MVRAAILVVDMLRDFLEGPFAGPEAARLVPRLRTVLDRARTLGIPVVFVCDAHGPDDPEFAVFPPHAIAGTPGAQVVEALAPLPTERVVQKCRYSGFFATDLEAALRDLRVDTLVLTGLQTDCCVLHTAADGFFRGFGIVILEDAVAARTREGGRWGLDQARRLYGARVCEAATFLEAAGAHG